MISIRGIWFDGRTSARIDATLKVNQAGSWRLVRTGDGELLLKAPEFSARVSARLANTPRYLTFSQGGSLETMDHESVDALLTLLQRGNWSKWVHRFESHLRYILPALAIFVVIAFGAVKYGVPAAARIIAARLPAVLFEKAGQQTLNVLDKMVFEPSELEPETVRRLRQHFEVALDAHPKQKLAVLFRKGGRIGPNAFALPGGSIVLTDEMVKMAKHDDELLAVLAHEIGHEVHQHSMRRVVQDSLLSFAVLALTGDASGVSELFLGMPVMLTELAYSRGFESEADRYALDFMRAHDIPTHYFADILLRIGDQDKPKRKGKDRRWSNYLSTHPATKERVAAFQESPHG